ncbi:methyltransferase domain-containing protein [bacterium]|nr:methyltransferase domain-containing protein [bacterium]
MLNHAKENAGEHVSQIEWVRADVQNLEKMQDESMDVIVTRNLTWNLEAPQKAYEEWYRVLKKGGILLNFDAGWYNYLFDDGLQEAYEQDRENVKDAEVFDFNGYDEAYKMEEIARELVLSRCERPAEDIRMMKDAGFGEVTADQEIWKKVWDDAEKINFASTPLFMLRAVK